MNNKKKNNISTEYIALNIFFISELNIFIIKKREIIKDINSIIYIIVKVNSYK